MSHKSRRAVLGAVGSATIGSTAGCLGLLSTDLSVWVRNDAEEEIDYEIQVDDFEESGSLDGGEMDRFDEVVDRPGSGESVEITLQFGIRVDGEFVDIATVSETDTLPIETGIDEVFARYTDRGVFYGATDEGDGTDDG